MQVLIPISFVGTVWKEIVQFFVDIEPISNLIEKSLITAERKSTNKLNVSNGVSIELLNFSTGYDNKTILSDISAEFDNKKFTAIVGSSGSGKSLILKALLGFVKPRSGEVRWNNRNLYDLDFLEISKYAAVVPQNVFLIRGSIESNIRYSSKGVTALDIDRAIKASQLSDRIGSFKYGLQTDVGEHGLKLSGGERQLIGLARALVRNPKVLILDEPTSALDAKTEIDLINQTILSLTDLTRIMVTHQLKLAIYADNILVVDRGRIVEQGTHQELLNKRGFYYNLWCSQNN